MKHTLATVVISIAACSGTQSANAQYRFDRAHTIDLADYAVYFGDASVRGWYIQWLDDDGHVVREDGVYNSEEDADARVNWHFFGGHEPTNNARVIYTSRPGRWHHFETFDTIEEAEMWADTIDSLGLLVDIRRIQKYDLSVLDSALPVPLTTLQPHDRFRFDGGR